MILRAFVQIPSREHTICSGHDLNLNGFTAQSPQSSGTVIGGTFKGVYDGGGYKITGLKLNNLSTNGNAALFHTVSGAVKNLTIDKRTAASPPASWSAPSPCI